VKIEQPAKEIDFKRKFDAKASDIKLNPFSVIRKFLLKSRLVS
jgi:hypothetical protein